MIEGLKPYPKYRRTGVAWMASLPEHWAPQRCRFLFREVDNRSEAGEETHLSMSQKLGLVPSSMVARGSLVSASYAGGKLCQADDLVLNRLKAHLGVFARASQPGVISPDYTVLRPRRALSVRYFEEVLKSPSCRWELRTRTKGIVEGFWRLYTDDFYNVPVPVPPPNEQAAIVKFIDHADRRIRRYIRAKQKLIKLLEEQKQAIIHQAVTRGLDPNVRLKPSGVEWLGDVPEHWEVVRGKHIGRLFSTPAIGDGHLVEGASDGVMYLKVSDLTLSAGSVRLSCSQLHASKSPPAWMEGQTFLVFPKRGGAIFTNKVAIVEEPCFLDPNLMGWRVGARFEPEYVALLLQTRTLQDLADVSSVPQINNHHIQPEPFPAPPRPEQKGILAHLRKELRSLNQALTDAQLQSSLMREYRTRLISDVVTGKLDVRAAAVALPDEVDHDEPELEESDEDLGDDTDLPDEDADE
jgi:type I restriction enzyme S subunit